MRMVLGMWRVAPMLGWVILALAVSANGGVAQDRAKIEIIPHVPHSAEVLTAAFSPDGMRLLSGSWDNTLKLWDAATGHLIRTFETHDSVYSVAFSPDGTRLLSRDEKGNLKVWDAMTGRLVRTFEVMVFSSDGSRLLSGSDDTLRLWDASTGQLIHTFPGHASGLSSVAFSPDGTRLLTGGWGKTLTVWDTTTGQPIRTFEGHEAAVETVAFSPDGTRLLSGREWPYALKLWDAATGQLIRSFEGHDDKIYSVAFSPDGARLLSGSSDKTLKLWDATTGEVRTFEGHADAVNSVAFSPDGARLLSASNDTTLKLWDTTGQLIRTFGSHASVVSRVVFSSDGTHLLSANWNHTINLWDAATGQMIRTFEGHASKVSALAFSPDGTRVVSGGEDKTLTLLNAASGEVVRSFKAGSNTVTSVAVSPDGTRLLSGSWEDGTLTMWDAASGQLIRTLSTGAGVSSLAFSPDGARLLSGHSDSTLKLWDAATGQLIRSIEGHGFIVSSVAFSPDGTRLLSGSWDNTLKLWDTATGQLVRTFEAHTALVWFVIFSPDGKQVLSASDDRTLRLWDTSTGQLVHTFEGHTALIGSAAFSPDGKRIVSASNDDTIRLWDAETGSPVVVHMGGRGDWVAMTPAGFFAGSRGDADLLNIVRGLEVFPVAQFRDHLYRPDLLEALLKGDPEGKYADAASKLNLETILDSGPAPQIETIPGRKTERIGDTIRITLRLVDTGGGIGEKVVWRVNGVTQGEVSDPNAPRTGYRVIEQTLKLAPGQDNIVEITAYNGAGLLATTPWRHVEGKFGEPSGARMHILAVGVSEYARKDWHLRYAANDAKSFAELMQTAGKAKGLYDDVRASLVLETEATEKGIEAAIERMRGDVGANDVFILYLAGHGKNIAGTYYFLPQDLTFEGGRTIQKDAIDQNKLQRWLARIPAQKSILILDTCESEGAARSLAVERETAVERLRHATGRSVIAAASAAAYEGFNGHGLLTWAIRDAFTQRDDSSGDFVELLPLAAYIDRQVPAISQKWLGIVQRPHHKIEGNFPLGVRLASVPTASDADAKDIPKTPTHVLIRPERVRQRAAADAPGERELRPGAQVRVVRLVEQWAVIAREGQELGYVPADALADLQ